MEYTYKQETKQIVRHRIIRTAVEMLTVNRSHACCVRNSYVRDLYDYFSHLDESHEQEEALKINVDYIREWERMHSILTGSKMPSELTVCYLSGPEPENDFNEFVSMGVLPQNIWAFESERSTYLQALQAVDGSTYMQPKIIKTSIERFFENTPKKFDIVYIDACASLISDQHALRCVSSLFQNQRLNSPGVLITNFAFLNDSDTSEVNQYVDLISRFKIIHNNRNAALVNQNGMISYHIEAGKADDVYSEVQSNLVEEYGELITAMVCNAASITIPALRFANSTYLQALSTTMPKKRVQYSFSEINTIKDNTLFKYLASNAFLQQEGSQLAGINSIRKLMEELSGLGFHFDLLAALRMLHNIRIGNNSTPADLQPIIDYFDNSNALFQFLDKPNRVLFFDSVINQLSYPMHYTSDKATRLSYVAKKKRMFTDLLVFDECRYIYDWLPSIHQIPKSFSNRSWQYTFRFGLDGLIKQRINYNNEFFFQGSVVLKNAAGFEAKHFPDRVYIN